MASTSDNQQNDSDDWTLLSPPHSSTSDSEQGSDKSSSHSSIENLSGGNLSEIDLNDTENCGENVTSQYVESNRSNITEQLVPGFQAICSSSDDDDDGTNSRGSSVTNSDLVDYVDIGRSLTRVKTLLDKEVIKIASSSGVTVQTDLNVIRERELDRSLILLKSRFDELSKKTSKSSTLRLRKYLNFLFIALPFIMLICSAFLASLNDSRKANYEEHIFMNQIKKSTTHRHHHIRHFAELQKFDNEIRQCVERQSQAAFKSLASDVKNRFEEHEEKIRRPSKGMVCFGQESYWIKKVSEFQSRYNLDLRMINSNREIDVPEFTQISTQFRFIMNQIDYIVFLEEKRKRKHTEDLIKHLRAENHQLLRRLNEPNETGYQKLVVNLELENSRLRRENEALKSALVQKAGPTYIKQSKELEYHERENAMLKKFYHQVAQDVTKALKQFNLHIIDPSTILDDEESLSSQLALTRGYLRRLSEKISTLLNDNESLKEELKDSYFISSNQLVYPESTDSHLDFANNSNALSADSCAKSLQEERVKTNHLEGELERLRGDCYKSKNVDLELSSSRQLNRSSRDDENSIVAYPPTWISRLKSDSSKRLPDSMSLGNDEIVDELMAFLTRFNSQIEANRKIMLSSQNLQDKTALASETATYPENANSKVTTLPNYIREAIREVKASLQNDRLVQDGLMTVPLPRNAQLCEPVQGSGYMTYPPRCVPIFRPQNNATLLNKQHKLRAPHKNATQADWITKRAQLREKLRAATTYMDNVVSGHEISHKKSSKHTTQFKRSKYKQDCKRQKRNSRQSNGRKRQVHHSKFDRKISTLNLHDKLM